MAEGAPDQPPQRAAPSFSTTKFAKVIGGQLLRFTGPMSPCRIREGGETMHRA